MLSEAQRWEEKKKHIWKKKSAPTPTTRRCGGRAQEYTTWSITIEEMGMQRTFGHVFEREVVLACVFLLEEGCESVKTHTTATEVFEFQSKTKR
jgi:hypothetical protein